MTQINQPQPQQESQRLISRLLWILSAIYIYLLLLSPPEQILPGEPIWKIQPQTLQEIWQESVNFFFILPILNAIGINYLPAPSVHPWIESLFNFAEAWIFMFLPLLLADSRGRELPQRLIWTLAMFLTNVFLCPYMAVRAKIPQVLVKEQPAKNLMARVFGWIGLTVGIIACFWCFFGRPEFGNLTQRVDYFVGHLMSDRVTIAFCVDLVFFGIFQAILLGEIEPVDSWKRGLRFIPFWGLAAWLIL